MNFPPQPTKLGAPKFRRGWGAKILRIEMQRTTRLHEHRPVHQPLIPGRLDLDGRRRTSPDKLLLSLLLSAQNDAWIGKNRDFSRFFKVVPAEGLEPPRPSGQQILSLSRLPFRHAGKLVQLVVNLGSAVGTWQWKPSDTGGDESPMLHQRPAR